MFHSKEFEFISNFAFFHFSTFPTCDSMYSLYRHQAIDLFTVMH